MPKNILKHILIEKIIRNYFKKYKLNNLETLKIAF